MENKNRTVWLWPGLLAALGTLTPFWTPGGDSAGLPLPWLTAFGKWLRALSLKSAGGNVLAWGIVLAVTALPLIFLLWRRRRGGWRKYDVLLCLLSALLFALCWFLVNPSYLPSPAGSFFPLGCAGAALSALAAWFVFDILRALGDAPTEKLAAAARTLLVVWASLQAFSACYTQMAAFLSSRAEIIEGNTAGGWGLTVFVTGAVDLLSAAPGLLAAVTLVWAAQLAGAIGDRVFSEKTVELCQRTARGCRRVAELELLIAVAANLLQLILLGRLRSTHFSVTLPLLPLALAGALYLLCRCLQQGKALQDDSDSII